MVQFHHARKMVSSQPESLAMRVQMFRYQEVKNGSVRGMVLQVLRGSTESSVRAMVYFGTPSLQGRSCISHKLLQAGLEHNELTAQDSGLSLRKIR